MPRKQFVFAAADFEDYNCPYSTSEHNLLNAILERALRDLDTVDELAAYWKITAAKWILEPNYKQWSFNWIVEHLNYSPVKIAEFRIKAQNVKDKLENERRSRGIGIFEIPPRERFYRTSYSTVLRDRG